jgi:hypothetical protein
MLKVWPLKILMEPMGLSVFLGMYFIIQSAAARFMFLMSLEKVPCQE